MPAIHRYVFTGIFIFAVASLAALVPLGGKDSERRTALLVSIAASFLVVSIAELTPEIVRAVSHYTKRARFLRFFGDAAFKHETCLVFAHRQLKKLQNDPWVFDQEPHLHLPGGERPWAEGVDAWLAVQDIRAAVYLTSELYEMTGKGVSVIHDKDVHFPAFHRHCAISIGLGFNAFTWRLAELCKNDLFKIYWGESPKAGFGHKTDLFKIGDREPTPSDDGHDYCLVARVVTDAGSRTRICFACAGRTAQGTAAGGYFLARKWNQLMKLYDRHGKDLGRDSLAVVIRHTSSGKDSQEFDQTCEIAEDDGSQLIQWGRIEGLG